MLLAGIISHSEETAGLIRRFLGEMTRSRGLSLSCVSYDNSYAFLGDWRRGEERFDLLFWDLSFLPEGAMQTCGSGGVIRKWFFLQRMTAAHSLPSVWERSTTCSFQRRRRR